MVDITFGSLKSDVSRSASSASRSVRGGVGYSDTWLQRNWIVLFIVVLLLGAAATVYYSLKQRSARPGSAEEETAKKDQKKKEHFSDFPQQVTHENQLQPRGSVIKFVKFYTPWCGFCKAIASTWDDLAAKYHGTSKSGKTVHILSVDCEAHPELGKKYQVRGYPTLKLFSNGSVKTHNGPRSLSALEGFLNKHL